MQPNVQLLTTAKRLHRDVRGRAHYNPSADQFEMGSRRSIGDKASRSCCRVQEAEPRQTAAWYVEGF